MDTTVERLKVGTQVIIGSYGVNNDEPHPVVWLKGSPNCDFITECAVDYLCFDAPERTGDGRRNLGNPDYRLSNIHTYLNSDRDDWFRKTHEADAPPNNVFSNRAQSYRNHYGFLYFFEDYELDSLQMQQYVVDGETLSSLIRLPTITDILDDQLKLKLFSKKGIRPKATEDCANKKGRFGNFSWESYMNFWLAGKAEVTNCRGGKHRLPRRMTIDSSGAPKAPWTSTREPTAGIAQQTWLVKYYPTQNPPKSRQLFST